MAAQTLSMLLPTGPREVARPDAGITVAKSDLPACAARLIAAYFQKDYAPLVGFLAKDCLLIGAGSDISYGVRSLRDVLDANAAMPTYIIRDARFHLVETSSPTEAVIAGFYTIYSDADHRMLSSERQRVTINCRQEDGAWKAYLVHVSNEWGPLDEGVAFPARVSEQTYRYVQDILRASKIRDGGSVENIALPVQEGTTFVNPTRIIYAEANAKRTTVHLIDQVISVKLLLANVFELLPGQFSRVHRSYVVNRSHITSLAGDELVMSNGDRIPIPKRKRHEIERELSRTGWSHRAR